MSVFSRWIGILFRVALLALLVGSCDESLPLYEEPETVLAGKLEVLYDLSPINNRLIVGFIIKNVFDETLEAPGVLRGSVEIESLRNPEVRRTYMIGPGSLIAARGYNPATGTLRIDARDSIRFNVSWDFVADDRGVDLRSDFFSYMQDVSCNDAFINRCLAYTEDFTIRAEVKVYDQRAPVRVSRPYAMCFVSRWVNPKFCPPVLTSAECNLRPPQQAGACFPKDFSPILGRIAESVR